VVVSGTTALFMAGEYDDPGIWIQPVSGIGGTPSFGASASVGSSTHNGASNQALLTGGSTSTFGVYGDNGASTNTPMP
jgi:hypothetical protein